MSHPMSDTAPGRELTAARLKELGACEDQVRLFTATFGRSVVVTEALAVEYAAAFSWSWAAQRLLTAPARAKYDRVTAPAWAECERATAPAHAEYNRVEAAAQAEYNRVAEAAWAEFKRVRAAAWAECNRVTAAAWAEYEHVTAAAWARLYIQEGQQ